MLRKVFDSMSLPPLTKSESSYKCRLSKISVLYERRDFSLDYKREPLIKVVNQPRYRLV